LVAGVALFGLLGVAESIRASVSVKSHAFPGHPTEIAVEPTSRRVYAVSGTTGGTVVAMHLDTGEVLETFSTGGGEIGLAADPVASRVFVATQGSSSVQVFDAAEDASIGSFSIQGGAGKMDLDPARRHLYIVSNIESVACYDLESWPPSLVWSASTGLGTDGHQVVAADPANGWVWVIQQGDPWVLRYDSDDGTLLGTIELPSGTGPLDIDALPSMGTAVVTAGSGGSQAIFLDAGTDSIIETVSVSANNVACDDERGLVYVGSGPVRLSVLDASTHEVLETTEVGFRALQDLWVDEHTGNVVASEFGNDQDGTEGEILVVTSSFAGPPDPVSLGTIADTYLRQGHPNQNQGGEEFLRVRADGNNRALVRFEQDAIEDALGSRPLASAKLRLYIADNHDNWGSSGREVTVHRMLAAWTEDGATWNSPDDQDTSNSKVDGNAWEMGGNDESEWPYAASATDSITHANGLLGWVEWDVTEDVEAFLSGSSTNHGWLVRKVEEGQAGRVEYDSREAAGNAPVLVIQAE
jgi:DNA-binding beta-propeller fold protein YncE